jgi:predicted metal-dependent phosphoesterase TrpH
VSDAPVAQVDLHCHTSASFDGVADPVALAARAAERGITHLAITDHETIEGALRAAASAPAGLKVLVGSEVNTREGDLVFVFLEHPLPRGLSARDAIEAGRQQGALVGIPHPFDTSRRSLLLEPSNEELVALVDWVEAWNGRVTRREANTKAADLARRAGLPAIGVSDSHTLLEVGSAYTTMSGDPSTAAGLRKALSGPLAIVSAVSVSTPGRFARLMRPRKRP